MKRLICFVSVIAMLAGLLPCVSLAAEEEITYLLRDVNEGAVTEVSMDEYETYETEHFQIFWGTDGANSAKVTADFLETCELVLENCWTLYMDKMGMEPTSTSVNWNGDKKTHYKTNVILMGTGIEYYDLGANEWGAYGSVDTEGYPYFMCCLAAMSSPTVVAHEFGHSTHYAQGDNAWKDNIYLGPWFEAVANWFAEQYIYEYLSPNQTQMSGLYLRSNHLTKMNGRAYYEAWPILQYLEEDPDNTGVYGTGFVQKVLSTNLGSTEVMFWDVLEEANGDSITTADTVGMFASHMATMDFAHKENYNNRINAEMSAKVLYWQQRYTMLEKLDGVSVYAVPTEKAPQAMGYNIIPLEFTPGEVEVKVNPLTDEKGASWRARIVTERNGETIYSKLFKEGEAVSVQALEGDKIYLTVAATPELSSMVKHTIGGWATHSKESNLPFENKTQYPYSVTMTNCEPMKRPKTGYGMMTIHPNGGGRKSFNAKVSDSAYIGPDAIVWGNATVGDNAIIDGYAIVGGNAKVSGNAYVGDYAIVYDRAQISDNARVIENACVYVDYKVSGNAVVKGSSLGLYNGSATGDAVCYGDWFEDEGKIVEKGSYSGYHSLTSDENYASSRLYMPSIRAKYDFNENMRDAIAYSDMYEVEEVNIENGCAIFDGGYLSLNESVLHYDDMKLRLKVRGEGDVLNIGDCIKLSLSDDMAVLTLGEESLINEKVEEDWNEVEVEFYNGVVTLKVNGRKEMLESAVTPLGANMAQNSYLGKNFTGDIDYLYVYDSISEKAYEEISASGSSLISDDVVFDCENSNETGALNAKTNDKSSVWYGWNCASGNVTVDSGLIISGNVNSIVESPGYETDKFVIEFKPEGGNAYPDHGVIDVNSKVLFAHRFASDADTIYVGRGETNDSVRGSASLNDTAGQKRLTSFVAEKLCENSKRTDRGALDYTSATRVRITAENYKWNEDIENYFSTAENSTTNLDKMKNGDLIYLVTYSLLFDEEEVPVSVSVYKGNFEGFGGFKIAGGANGVNVCYKDLKIYIAEDVRVNITDGVVLVEGLDDDAVAVFATYDENTLENIAIKNIEDGACNVPEGFSGGKVMIFESTRSLKPLTGLVSVGE